MSFPLISSFFSLFRQFFHPIISSRSISTLLFVLSVATMPSRRREGESLQWLLCFFLCWLVTFSQADKQLGHIMLLNTTGFDGKSTEYKNKVADLCTSNDFIFGEKNINKTDIVHYYANWTRAHRKEIEANGNEFRYLGVHLLGQPNFRCELSRGFCFEMPSCEVVATHMNLPTDAEISQPDAEELRRRYFFPKILDEEIHFQYVLRVSLFTMPSYYLLIKS